MPALRVRNTTLARTNASSLTANPRPISLPPTGVHWNATAYERVSCFMDSENESLRPTCK
jgi:hypothetical protein